MAEEWRVYWLSGQVLCRPPIGAASRGWALNVMKKWGDGLADLSPRPPRLAAPDFAMLHPGNGV
jgi:hypothetical protein